MDLAASRDAAPSLAERFARWHWSSALLTGLAFLVCILIWLVTDAQAMQSLMSEEGPVEKGTAVGYGIAALALLTQARRDPRFYISSAIVVVLFMLRELDFDHAFTSESVVAIRFYSFASVPLVQKLVATPIILALVLFVLAYVWRYGMGLARGVLAKRAEAWTLVNVFLLLAYSVLIDGLPRKLHGMLGIDLPQPQANHLLSGLEEGMELAIPVMILWALLQTILAGRRAIASRTAVASSQRRVEASRAAIQ